MDTASSTKPLSARERLLNAAYGLFSTRGIGQVGIDTIVSESGCAKSSLYNNFESKEALALTFLDRREERWTREWLESEVRQRASDPEARLLVIFDVFDDWFRRADFEGCAFINVLLESSIGSPVREAASNQLAKIRDIVRGFAEDARLVDPDAFAQIWHMLMKGSIVSAGEGNQEAARQAQRAGRLVLDGWARRDIHSA